MWTRILYAIGIAVSVVFFAAAFTPATNYAGARFAPEAVVKRSQAIVVLGAGLWRGGMLDDQSLRRAIYGIELYKKGLAPIIVFSGPKSGNHATPSEAEARSQLALLMSVPSEAILKEDAALTTREESINISRSLASRHIHQILLVTESFHMRRAKYAFELTGFEVLAAPSDNFAVASVSLGERLWLASRILEESAGLAYYRLAGYI